MTRSCLVFFVFVFGGYCLCFQWILQTHHVELSYVFLCGFAIIFAFELIK